MRIACVSLHCDPDLRQPDQLLARYHTLASWAQALAGAGAQTTIVQRFSVTTEVRHGGVCCRFVAESARERPAWLNRFPATAAEAARLKPDIALVHGMRHAPAAAEIKRRLPAGKVAVQEHAEDPPRLPGRLVLRSAFRQVDAVMASTTSHILPWRSAGVLGPNTRVIEVMEGSTRFRLRRQDAARQETGLSGDPLCVWVGRLNANKDPLAVLRGLERAAERLPRLHLAMAFTEAPLLRDVRAWLAERPDRAARVTLLGAVPHDRVEALLNSADLLVLGSHEEGSGYAVIEGLACGAVPVVTDIPSFRALTDGGRVGGLWRVGDHHSLADSLVYCAYRLDSETRARVRDHFDRRFSYPALARTALAAFQELLGGDHRP